MREMLEKGVYFGRMGKLSRVVRGGGGSEKRVCFNRSSEAIFRVRALYSPNLFSPVMMIT